MAYRSQNVSHINKINIGKYVQLWMVVFLLSVDLRSMFILILTNSMH